MRCGETIARMWTDRSTRHGGSRCLSLRHFLAREADEFHRIKQKRGKAAIAHGGRYNLSGKWKQESRAFDQHDRIQTLLRNIADAEYARKLQVEAE